MGPNKRLQSPPTPLLSGPSFALVWPLVELWASSWAGRDLHVSTTDKFGFTPKLPFESSGRETEETTRRETRHRKRRTSPPKMVRNASSSLRKRVSSAILLVLVCLNVVSECSNNESRVECSRTCVAINCNSVGIRYGKFCGVGWTGCAGEKPCDDLDACCKVHDECVERKGLTNVKCHEKFKSCIKRVQKSGKAGFSQECPYATAVPTMVQGMDLAIMLSQFGNSKLEL